MFIKLFLCTCLFICSNSRLARKMVIDSKLIEKTELDSQTEITVDEETTNRPVCAREEMNEFGLASRNLPIHETNAACPGLKKNCCSPENVEKISKMHKRSEQKQTQYFIAFLSINRYILGLSKIYKRLAKDIFLYSKLVKITRKKAKTNIYFSSDFLLPPVSPKRSYTIVYHKTCETASYKLMQMSYLKTKAARQFQIALKKRSSFYKRSRRGFYCILCMEKATEFLGNYDKNRNKNVKLSKEFCQRMFDYGYETTFEFYRTYNKFLKYLLEMLACVRPRDPEDLQPGKLLPKNDQVPQKYSPFSMSVNLNLKDPLDSLPKTTNSIFHSLLSMKRTSWMDDCRESASPNKIQHPKCLGFCESFNFFKADKVIDGDLDVMYSLYVNLKEYEFIAPNLVITTFGDEVKKLKSKIEENYSALEGNYDFLAEHSLTKKTTEFHSTITVSEGSPDPYSIAKGGILSSVSLTNLIIKVMYGAGLVFGCLF